MRRAFIAAISLGAVLCWGPPVQAQFRQRFVPRNETQVTAETDRGVRLALENAQRYLKLQQYGSAVSRLQSVLDHPEDFFLVEDFKTKIGEQPRVRAQALRLLAELPEAGRKEYELLVGTTARDRLKHALATSDANELSVVASTYRMTAAGFDALQIQVSVALDHDQPLEAAMLCDALLGHPRAHGATRASVLLQSAYAWYLTGETERSVKALRELKMSNAAMTWQIGGRALSPLGKLSDATVWLQTQFGSFVQPPVNIVPAWREPRGGSTGNESAVTTFPVGGNAWSVSTLKYLRFPVGDDANRQTVDEFREMTQQVEMTMRDANRLIQPAAIPLVIGDAVVYRTLNDVTAVSLKTGKLLWRSSTSDGMISWLLQSPIAKSETIPSSSPLTFRGYLRFKLFRDQSSGSLTSDGQYVYAIEESDSQFAAFLPRNRMQFGMPMFADPTNKLVAYELAGGRLAWEIGGPGGTPPHEFSGSFFLGPPQPYNGRLYCLVESKNEIRLLTLVPGSNSVRLESSQSLIGAESSQFGALRRLAGSIPAVASGIAICPTAEGAVVAFDLVQRQLKWGYSYDSLSSRNAPEAIESLFDEEEGRWLDVGPVLSDRFVVLTPRDSAELHCVDLIDGSLIWKRPRDEGLYVACIADNRVIVVERSQVKAYALAEGSPVWAEPTQIPEPSGRGVRIGSQYLLPLSTGEIATLELATGRIVARSRLPDDRMPGNLAIGADGVVSRGLGDVDGFRSLSDIEIEIAGLMSANPKDARALALRGELRLHQGQENEGIDDLRRSLLEQPSPRVRLILAETLLNRLRSDPKKLLESSSELESLANDPRQRIEFLRLTAKSLNETGDPVGAVAQLFRLLAGSKIPDETISIGPDHFVSLEQSLRSQLFTIYDRANPREKTEIVGVFAKEFNAAVKSDKRDQRLARFVTLTIGHPAADALLFQLAETKDAMPAEWTRTRLLERLTKSGNRAVGGTAIAVLAANFLADNSPREAQPWIEELGREFASVVCRDGKTGRQLADQWGGRDDVRKLAVAKFNWQPGPVETDRKVEETDSLIFPVDVVTHVGNHFVGWSFEVNVVEAELIARDRSLRVVWRLPLGDLSDDVHMQPNQLHICGRRLAYSSPMRFAVIEATELEDVPRILFEQSLRPNSLVPYRAYRDKLERRLLPNGHRFQLSVDARGMAGFLLGLTDDAVCFQIDNRLHAADPQTGRILWTRVGSQFAKANGTVDRTSVLLNTAENGALLLGTLDGEIGQQFPGNPDETPLWFRGTRRLSQRLEPAEKRVYEMRDFTNDHVWEAKHPAGSIPAVVDTDLVVLEPSGRLVVCDLNSGDERLVTELPIRRLPGAGGVISAHRYEDLYVIVAGVVAKNRRIVPLDFGPPGEFGLSSIEAFTIDGHVSAIDRNTGQVKWTIPVSDLAFDPSQPVNLPVLVFASRYNEREFMNRMGQASRGSVLILDKRTGMTVFEGEESMTPPGRGIRFHALVEEHRLVVDFSTWQLELTFPPEK